MIVINEQLEKEPTKMYKEKQYKLHLHLKIFLDVFLK